MKRYLKIIGMFFLLCLISIELTAKDSNEGNAVLTIKGGNNSLVGSEFVLYHVMSSENADGLESIYYDFIPETKEALREVISNSKANKGEDISPDEITEDIAYDFIQKLDRSSGRNSELRYFTEDLRDGFKRYNIEGQKIEIDKVEEDNSFKVEGLKEGYYLIDDVTKKGGSHDRHFTSGLILMTTLNPKGEVVVKEDLPVIKKKIQEDDEIEVIGNNGWNDIGDYEIGQIIPYKYETRIFNMSGMDSCMYAFHDKMDEGLHLKGNINIKIIGDDKEYNLKEEEYKLIKKEVEEGEEFTIKIPDIKKICDREFNEEYGQKVILTFEGFLDEFCADKCGRPGFENDVKLEYSNDFEIGGEEKTGETPIDTVVCYTFGLKFNKVNEDDKKLKGAKFKLFRDEEEKDIVYFLRRSDGAYIVSGENSGISEIESDDKGEIIMLGLD